MNCLQQCHLPKKCKRCRSGSCASVRGASIAYGRPLVAEVHSWSLRDHSGDCAQKHSSVVDAQMRLPVLRHVLHDVEQGRERKQPLLASDYVPSPHRRFLP